jgi:phenylalanyl-tRNA synthetase alpha chain
MTQEFEKLKAEADAAIAQADSLNALDAVRVAYLGKNGAVTGLLKQVGSLPAEERKGFGEQVNILRDALSQAVSAKQTLLDQAALAARLSSETIDISLPPSVASLGQIHPITQTIDEIIAIFAQMGFALQTGPEIEDDFHNFTALNFAEDHPARSMHDTFFLEKDSDEAGAPKLLRTHTSTVQIRAMLDKKPPLKILVPGRVYRSEMDATHTAMFHQVEGFVVDKIGAFHMGHLKGCLTDFIQAFFNVPHCPVRFRPSYFPFTEPSAEVDIGYARRDGKIILGEKGKWMEVLGCGMIHPNVLRNCGIDPNEYQGFAFGLGVERFAMLKYGIPDLRDMFDGDLRWLKHYGFSVLDQPHRGLGA